MNSNQAITAKAACASFFFAQAQWRQKKRVQQRQRQAAPMECATTSPSFSSSPSVVSLPVPGVEDPLPRGPPPPPPTSSPASASATPPALTSTHPSPSPSRVVPESTSTPLDILSMRETYAGLSPSSSEAAPGVVVASTTVDPVQATPPHPCKSGGRDACHHHEEVGMDPLVPSVRPGSRSSSPPSPSTTTVGPRTPVKWERKKKACRIPTCSPWRLSPRSAALLVHRAVPPSSPPAPPSSFSLGIPAQMNPSGGLRFEEKVYCMDYHPFFQYVLVGAASLIAFIRVSPGGLHGISPWEGGYSPRHRLKSLPPNREESPREAGGPSSPSASATWNRSPFMTVEGRYKSPKKIDGITWYPSDAEATFAYADSEGHRLVILMDVLQRDTAPDALRHTYTVKALSRRHEKLEPCGVDPPRIGLSSFPPPSSSLSVASLLAAPGVSSTGAGGSGGGVWREEERDPKLFPSSSPLPLSQAGKKGKREDPKEEEKQKKRTFVYRQRYPKTGALEVIEFSIPLPTAHPTPFPHLSTTTTTPMMMMMGSPSTASPSSSSSPSASISSVMSNPTHLAWDPHRPYTIAITAASTFFEIWELPSQWTPSPSILEAAGVSEAEEDERKKKKNKPKPPPLSHLRWTTQSSSGGRGRGGGEESSSSSSVAAATTQSPSPPPPPMAGATSPAKDDWRSALGKELGEEEWGIMHAPRLRLRPSPECCAAVMQRWFSTSTTPSSPPPPLPAAGRRSPMPGHPSPSFPAPGPRSRPSFPASTPWCVPQAIAFSPSEPDWIVVLLQPLAAAAPVVTAGSGGMGMVASPPSTTMMPYRPPMMSSSSTTTAGMMVSTMTTASSCTMAGPPPPPPALYGGGSGLLPHTTTQMEQAALRSGKVLIFCQREIREEVLVVERKHRHVPPSCSFSSSVSSSSTVVAVSGVRPLLDITSSSIGSTPHLGTEAHTPPEEAHRFGHVASAGSPASPQRGSLRPPPTPPPLPARIEVTVIKIIDVKGDQGLSLAFHPLYHDLLAVAYRSSHQAQVATTVEFWQLEKKKTKRIHSHAVSPEGKIAPHHPSRTRGSLPCGTGRGTTTNREEAEKQQPSRSSSADSSSPRESSSTPVSSPASSSTSLYPHGVPHGIGVSLCLPLLPPVFHGDHLMQEVDSPGYHSHTLPPSASTTASPLFFDAETPRSAMAMKSGKEEAAFVSPPQRNGPVRHSSDAPSTPSFSSSSSSSASSLEEKEWTSLSEVEVYEVFPPSCMSHTLGRFRWRTPTLPDMWHQISLPPSPHPTHHTTQRKAKKTIPKQEERGEEDASDPDGFPSAQTDSGEDTMVASSPPLPRKPSTCAFTVAPLPSMEEIVRSQLWWVATYAEKFVDPSSTSTSFSIWDAMHAECPLLQVTVSPHGLAPTAPGAYTSPTTTTPSPANPTPSTDRVQPLGPPVEPPRRFGPHPVDIQWIDSVSLMVAFQNGEVIFTSLASLPPQVWGALEESDLALWEKTPAVERPHDHHEPTRRPILEKTKSTYDRGARERPLPATPPRRRLHHPASPPPPPLLQEETKKDSNSTSSLVPRAPVDAFSTLLSLRSIVGLPTASALLPPPPSLPSFPHTLFFSPLAHFPSTMLQWNWFGSLVLLQDPRPSSSLEWSGGVVKRWRSTPIQGYREREEMAQDLPTTSRGSTTRDIPRSHRANTPQRSRYRNSSRRRRSGVVKEEKEETSAMVPSLLSYYRRMLCHDIALQVLSYWGILDTPHPPPSFSCGGGDGGSWWWKVIPSPTRDPYPSRMVSPVTTAPPPFFGPYIREPQYSVPLGPLLRFLYHQQEGKEAEGRRSRRSLKKQEPNEEKHLHQTKNAKLHRSSGPPSSSPPPPGAVSVGSSPLALTATTFLPHPSLSSLLTPSGPLQRLPSIQVYACFRSIPLASWKGYLVSPSASPSVQSGWSGVSYKEDQREKYRFLLFALQWDMGYDGARMVQQLKDAALEENERREKYKERQQRQQEKAEDDEKKRKEQQQRQQEEAENDQKKGGGGRQRRFSSSRTTPPASSAAEQEKKLKRRKKKKEGKDLEEEEDVAEEEEGSPKRRRAAAWSPASFPSSALRGAPPMTGVAGGWHSLQMFQALYAQVQQRVLPVFDALDHYMADRMWFNSWVTDQVYASTTAVVTSSPSSSCPPLLGSASWTAISASAWGIGSNSIPSTAAAEAYEEYRGGACRAQWWRAASHAWRSHSPSLILSVTEGQLDHASLLGDCQYCLTLCQLYCLWWKLRREIVEGVIRSLLSNLERTDKEEEKEEKKIIKQEKKKQKTTEKDARNGRNSVSLSGGPSSSLRRLRFELPPAVSPDSLSPSRGIGGGSSRSAAAAASVQHLAAMVSSLQASSFYKLLSSILYETCPLLPTEPSTIVYLGRKLSPIHAPSASSSIPSSGGSRPLLPLLSSPSASSHASAIASATEWQQRSLQWLDEYVSKLEALDFFTPLQEIHLISHQLWGLGNSVTPMGNVLLQQQNTYVSCACGGRGRQAVVYRPHGSPTQSPIVSPVHLNVRSFSPLEGTHRAPSMSKRGGGGEEKNGKEQRIKLIADKKAIHEHYSILSSTSTTMSRKMMHPNRFGGSSIPVGWIEDLLKEKLEEEETPVPSWSSTPLLSCGSAPHFSLGEIGHLIGNAFLPPPSSSPSPCRWHQRQQSTTPPPPPPPPEGACRSPPSLPTTSYFSRSLPSSLVSYRKNASERRSSFPLVAASHCTTTGGEENEVETKRVEPHANRPASRKTGSGASCSSSIATWERGTSNPGKSHGVHKGSNVHIAVARRWYRRCATLLLRHASASLRVSKTTSSRSVRSRLTLPHSFPPSPSSSPSSCSYALIAPSLPAVIPPGAYVAHQTRVWKYELWRVVWRYGQLQHAEQQLGKRPVPHTSTPATTRPFPGEEKKSRRKKAHRRRGSSDRTSMSSTPSSLSSSLLSCVEETPSTTPIVKPLPQEDDDDEVSFRSMPPPSLTNPFFAYASLSRASLPVYRPLPNGVCPSCHTFNANTCVICEVVVEGLFVRFPHCMHGGHHDHVEEWLSISSDCPACGMSLQETGRRTEDGVGKWCHRGDGAGMTPGKRLAMEQMEQELQNLFQEMD